MNFQGRGKSRSAGIMGTDFNLPDPHGQSGQQDLQVLICSQNYHFKNGGISVPSGVSVLISNQESGDLPKVETGGGVMILSRNERGLSRNRNRSVADAKGDLCLIADEDQTFPTGFQGHIRNAFEAFPEWDIITFQILDPDGKPWKAYPTTPFRHDKHSILRTCSIEIAFRLGKVKERGVIFDEKFGLGSKYPTGEEIIFLADSIKAGLKVGYFPAPVAAHPRESSGSDYVNPKLFVAKGAMFSRIYGFLGPLYCLAFILKKAKEIRSPYDVFRGFFLLLYGSSKFLIRR